MRQSAGDALVAACAEFVADVAERLSDESADRGVQVTLFNVVKAGFIRQLPNGNFAPATALDTIRLRRAV